MTQPELDGWMRQADLIERGRQPPVIIPWAAAPAKPQQAGHTQTYISKRIKK